MCTVDSLESNIHISLLLVDFVLLVCVHQDNQEDDLLIAKKLVVIPTAYHTTKFVLVHFDTDESCLQ